LFDAAADDDYSWMPYQIVKAEYIPFQQKLAMEDDMYFVPSVVESKKISLPYAADLVIADLDKVLKPLIMLFIYFLSFTHIYSAIIIAVQIIRRKLSV